MPEHPFNEAAERPEEVPERFVAIPAGATGYAVSEGDLWVAYIRESAEYGDEAMLRLFGGGRSVADVGIIVKNAARSHPDIPTGVASTVEVGWFRGDHTDIEALVSALKRYENFDAGIGEDKAAYDLRTTLNHAKREVEKRITDD